MKISKKTGIALVCGVAFILALIIVLHNNPNADPQEEIKKRSSVVRFWPVPV